MIFRNIGTQCEQELFNICNTKNFSAFDSLFERCSIIFNKDESESATHEDESEEIQFDILGQSLESSTNKTPTENVTKMDDVDRQRANSAKIQVNKSNKDEKSTGFKEYENVYIIVGAISVFVVFGMCLMYRKRKNVKPKRTSKVHEKFEPMELEEGPTDKRPSNGDVSLPASEIDIKQEKSVGTVLETEKNATEDSDLNEIKVEGKTEVIEETSENQDENGDSVEFTSEENEEDINELEQQICRKSRVTFDETQNQTRQISCVGLVPETEITKTETTDQV